MATVTETYILEHNEGSTTYPSSANVRWEAAQANGVIVSHTNTPIVDPSEVVAGKTRSNVVIVWRSAEDRAAYISGAAADATFQAWLTSSGTRKINQVIS